MGDFVDREPAKRAQLDDLGQVRIDRFQSKQRGVQRENGYYARRRYIAYLVDRHACNAMPPLVRAVTPRMIHEDSPHDLRGHAEKVGAVLPVDLALIDEAQVDLMHQRRRLQSMAGALVAKLACGNTPQLGVDQRKQLIERIWIAATPVAEKRSDVAGGGDRGALQNMCW